MRAVIIGLNSDIGYYLAERYSSLGYDIIGTFRTHNNRVDKYKAYRCDIGNDDDINEFAANCLEWDLFISAVGNLRPIGKFFDLDFCNWQDSVNINALAQLSVLHKIYPYRNKSKVVDAVFFAGGGVSRSVVDYSAYTLSKVMLIKMCEILNDEYADINPFIVGPGWVKTKIHYGTTPNAYNYDTVVNFLDTGDGVSMVSIFGFIEQLRGLKKEITGGRNFSIYDAINAGDDITRLKGNSNLYKLRRKE